MITSYFSFLRAAFLSFSAAYEQGRSQLHLFQALTGQQSQLPCRGVEGDPCTLQARVAIEGQLGQLVFGINQNW